MSEYIKPAHLTEGDTVGIVSPSSAIHDFPRRLKRGIDALGAMGLSTVLGPNSQSMFGDAAGTPEERAEDINNMFLDDSVKAIICSSGGYNANAVLPFLDFELIKSKPKIFCGFSDITALNIAINHKTKLVTFNGPTVLPSFGEAIAPFDFTIRNFKKALYDTNPIGSIEFSSISTQESPFWDREDNHQRQLKGVNVAYAASEGQATGKLIGGNLQTLCLLAGTEYFPDFEGTVLFLEETGGSVAMIERSLDQLKQIGVMDKIQGLIFGRTCRINNSQNSRTLPEVLHDLGGKYQIPIIADVDCGHTNPILTLPLGVDVSMDTERMDIMISESATC